MKAKKFVAGRRLSFVAADEAGKSVVIAIEPGDVFTVVGEAYDVSDVPAGIDAVEVAPDASAVVPEPVVEPEAAPALASARRVIRRPLVASAAPRQSIRQRVQDFRASAMQGSALENR
jgi:hypothetical protein